MKICTGCNSRFNNRDWACPVCGRTPGREHGFLSFVDTETSTHAGFDARFFPELHRLEERHFWFRHRTGLILQAIKACAAQARSLLEVGCGTGLVLSAVSRAFGAVELSGSDLHAEGLIFARARVPGAFFYRMDACRMPFEEEFDLILALDVLEHIEDDGLALREMFRSLRKGGRLIVTVPHHPWLWSVQDEASCHCRRYTRSSLIERTREAGFEILHTSSFMTVLLPVMALSRLAAHLRGAARGGHDPLRELRIPQALNWVFSGICRMEARILQAGLTLRAGGSLLCAAGKAG